MPWDFLFSLFPLAPPTESITQLIYVYNLSGISFGFVFAPFFPPNGNRWFAMWVEGVQLSEAALMEYPNLTYLTTISWVGESFVGWKCEKFRRWKLSLLFDHMMMLNIHTHTHARTHASSVLKDENFSHPTVPFMPKPASLFYCQRFLYLSFSSPNVLSWIEMKNFYTIEPQKKRKFTSCGWKFAWIFSRRDARRYWGFVGFSHCKKR